MWRLVAPSALRVSRNQDDWASRRRDEFESAEQFSLIVSAARRGTLDDPETIKAHMERRAMDPTNPRHLVG